MAGPARSSDTFSGILLSSVRSTGFWSAITAVVGVVGAVAGGILYLSVDELRNLSVSIIVVSIALLFLALVLSPRATAIFLIGRQGRYGSNVIIMTVAFFAVAVLVNLLLFLNPTRIDVTATRIFTLSPQTLQVLDTLDTPVRANAFFTSTDTGTAKQQADDLLNEFERHSKNFTYRFIDPELSRSVALQYDVTGFPTIVFEDLERGVQQKIASLTEQDFVTGVLVATGVDRKLVYFLTGHKEASVSRDIATGRSDDSGFDFALQGMQRDNYEIRPLSLQQIGAVPADAALLVIAGPKQDLEEGELEALTEYMKTGGRILALFDPDTPDSFLHFIGTWGTTLSRMTVADAMSNVAGQMLTPLAQKTNAQYLGGQGLGIVDQLDVTFFLDATSISPLIPMEDMPSFILMRPLAVTTPASWLETNVEDVGFDAGVERRGPFTLAAVVEATGTFDGSVRHPVAKFVIFGDSDFATNRYFYSNDNADFMLNAVNWLAEDYELISIRPKVFPFRQLVVNSKERDFIKWSSWVFPPAVMIALGAAVWWRRRS
jgi:hypothetical protein